MNLRGVGARGAPLDKVASRVENTGERALYGVPLVPLHGEIMEGDLVGVLLDHL